MRKMGGGKQMKLGILCTMINGFGRRGYYNSQEIGLGRALARKGHEVMIYKGDRPLRKRGKGPGGKKSDHLVSSHEASGSARLYGL